MVHHSEIRIWHLPECSSLLLLVLMIVRWGIYLQSFPFQIRRANVVADALSRLLLLRGMWDTDVFDGPAADSTTLSTLHVVDPNNISVESTRRPIPYVMPYTPYLTKLLTKRSNPKTSCQVARSLKPPHSRSAI